MAVHPLNVDPFPSVQPTGAPDNDYQRIDTSPEMFGAAGARALQVVGKGVEKAADATMDAEVARQTLNNEVHANEKLTWLAQEGSQRVEKFKQIEGKSAAMQLPQFQNDLQQLMKDTLEGESPAVRAHLSRGATSLVDRYQNYAANHAASQEHTWANKTAVDSAATWGNNAALAALNGTWEDVDSFLAASDDNIAKLYEQKGLDQTATAAELAKNRGTNVHSIIEMLTKQGDFKTAQAVLDKYQDGMDKGNLVKSIGVLQTRKEQRIGDEAASRAIAKAAEMQQGLPPIPGAAPAPTAGRVHNAIIIQESSGNANIRPSVNGAIGIGQIMPATFRQYARPGEFITNPEDNLAVSRRIIDDYYTRYHGDAARVAVAYFSGPGNVAPIGSPTPYVRNTADGYGKTVSSYVNDITRRVGKESFTAAKAEAVRLVLDRSDISMQAQQHALARINQQFTTAQLANESDQRAKKEANEGAVNDYVTQMLNNKFTGMLDNIANDPRLTGEAKLHLTDAMKKRSGSDVEEASQAYGPGFWSAYKAVTAPVGDPARIADATQLLGRAGPDGDLTLPGVQKLSQVLAANQRSVNDNAVNRSKVGLMNYAKGMLSFDQEMSAAGLKRSDPKGEAIFNGQFIPQYEAAYDAWVKAGKDAWDFLKPEKVDEMVKGLRSKQQMDMDRISHDAGLSGDKAPPVPPAPAGVDPVKWDRVIAVRPLQNGKAIDPGYWAKIVDIIRQAPTAQNIATFNEIAPGFNPQDIIDELSGKKAAPALSQPPAPPPLPTKEDIAGYQSTLQRMFALPKDTLQGIVGGLPQSAREKMQAGSKTLSDMFLRPPTQ